MPEPRTLCICVMVTRTSEGDWPPEEVDAALDLVTQVLTRHGYEAVATRDPPPGLDGRGLLEWFLGIAEPRAAPGEPGEPGEPPTRERGRQMTMDEVAGWRGMMEDNRHLQIVNRSRILQRDGREDVPIRIVVAIFAIFEENGLAPNYGNPKNVKTWVYGARELFIAAAHEDADTMDCLELIAEVVEAKLRERDAAARSYGKDAMTLSKPGAFVSYVRDKAGEHNRQGKAGRRKYKDWEGDGTTQVKQGKCDLKFGINFTCAGWNGWDEGAEHGSPETCPQCSFYDATATRDVLTPCGVHLPWRAGEVCPPHVWRVSGGRRRHCHNEERGINCPFIEREEGEDGE